MKFERIYIDDFGIIRNQVLEDLSPGINVIGGLNRAGKTTFTKLLRSFGYGISRGEDVPPANIEYRASADIEYDGTKDKILLAGYAGPKTSGNKEIEAIYGVDYYTYSRLFTIDLDELKKVDKEQDKLQYVLLGGGFREIVKIPSILKEIEKEAEKIGGKTGSPNTKEFKPYYNNIKNQLKIINEASEKLKEYEEKIKRLSEIEKEEEKIKSNITEREDKIYLLELIKANFETYMEIRKYTQLLEENHDFIETFSKAEIKDGERLNDNYMTLKDKLNKYKEQYENIFGNNTEILQRILSRKSEIININLNASGIKNRIYNHMKTETEINQEEERINKEIIALNSDLLIDREQIKSIKGDSLSISKIEDLIEEYNSCINDLEGAERDLSSLNANKAVYENLAKDYKENKLDKSYLKYMMANAAILVLGSLVFLYHKSIGSIISLTGVIAAGVYMLLSVKNNSEVREKRISLNKEYQDILSKIEQNETKKRKIQSDLKFAAGRLDDIKQMLKMSKDSPVSFIKTYYLRINTINQSLHQLEYKKTEEEKSFNELKTELNAVYKAAGEILGIDLKTDFKNVDGLFKETEKLSESIVICENYKNLHDELKKQQEVIRQELKIIGDIEEGIKSYIEKEKKYKSLKDFKNKKLFLQQRLGSSMNNKRADSLISGDYKALFEEFSSDREIEDKLQETEEELKEMNKIFNSLKEEKSAVSYQVKELNSYNKIDEAKINIAAERKNLEPLAKSYASLKAAAFILENIQKSFMEETKDKLLSGGSSILCQLTSGKFNKIMPEDDILSSDFKVEEEGKLIETSKYLSRATSEQLFLSVRLGRLKELQYKLPVIMDDSFVNFDSANMKNAVNVLKELSASNQVFILTCHGELIKYISETCKSASYYSLEQGKFRKSESAQLMDCLGI